MKEIFIPEPYQIYAINHLINNPKSALFLDMGLGKTVITLTAIAHLMRYGLLRRVLVIGPKNVAQTVWPLEVEKWQHLDGMKCEVIKGTEKKRLETLRGINLGKSAHIYTINRELVPWLTTHYGGSKMPFDMYVIDESTSFKSSDAVRFKALSPITPEAYRCVIETGTPVPNGMIDLWSQMYLLDGGLRLESTKGKFLSKYFYQEAIRGTKGRTRPVVIPGMENIINSKIKDIAISMTAQDLIKLQPVSYIEYPIELPDNLMQKYRKFKKDKILELGESLKEQQAAGLVDLSSFITANNALSLSTKLVQFASGAVYIDKNVNNDYTIIHDEKFEALEEIIESSSGGVLVACNFQHEYERLESKLKKYKPVFYKNKEHDKLWNEGKIKVMFCHAKTLCYGANLQYGGHTIVWLSLSNVLEQYLQFNMRLPRRGQVNRVNIYHILCKGTEDERVYRHIQQKDADQKAFIDDIKKDISDIMSGNML